MEPVAVQNPTGLMQTNSHRLRSAQKLLELGREALEGDPKRNMLTGNDHILSFVCEVEQCDPSVRFKLVTDHRGKDFRSSYCPYA